MFTGIIRTTGTVEDMKNGTLCIVPKGSLRVQEGDSVAVGGVCLTVEKKRGKVLFFSLMPSTIRTTNFRALKSGNIVNLELPLRYGDRLDGHFVLGHVDGVGHVYEVRPRKPRKGGPTSVEIAVRVPAALKKYCAPKGSIALDGVSLTIVSVRGRDLVVSLTPYTLRHTRFATVRVGDRVNVEVDVIARYFANLVS